MINKRLISLVPESMKHIRNNVIIQTISLVFSIVFIFNLAYFMDDIRLGIFENTRVLKFVIIAVLAVMVRFIAAGRASAESHKASVDIKNVLRDRIYEKLLNTGESYKKNMGTAEVLQNAVDGVQQIEIYFGAYLPQLFYCMVSPIILFAVISSISIKAATVLILCVPLIPVSIIAVQKFAKKILDKYWGQYLKLSDNFLENLQGLNTLKIYKSDEYKHKKMNEEAEHFRKITMKVLMMQLNSISMMDLIAYGGTALGVILASKGYLEGNVDFKGAIIIILLCSEFFLPLRLLGSFFHVAMNGMAASKKIFEILDMEDIEDNEKTVSDFDIKISNMSYIYDGGKKALENIDILMKEPGFYAFAGESGSGKSTIAGILSSDLSEYEGSILIGGCEIKDLSRKFIKEKICLISMTNHIFKGSIRYNLLMGKHDATDEEMREALRKVNLLSFIDEQQGLDTELKEEGSNFSGGQRQRLALARGILHESEIYIFDEATSNIDVESEEAIVSVLHELSKKKTVIFITHRLANLLEADMIYVLENGKLMEKGSHKTLVSMDAVYGRLWKKQYALESLREVK